MVHPACPEATERIGQDPDRPARPNCDLRGASDIEGFRIHHLSWHPEVGRLGGFIIASLSLVAALILRASSIDRATTKAQLRLVEANEKQLDLAKGTIVAPELRPTLLDSCPLATIAVDLHGIVTYWNAAAETLTGWARDEVVGHPLPFSEHGPIVNKWSNEVEAVLWTSTVQCANGAARGCFLIAAGCAALRNAGVSDPFGKHPVAASR